MLPPQGKEGKSILEQEKRARRPDPLKNIFMWKSPPQLIEEHQLKGLDGTLLDAFQNSVFGSDRQKELKWKKAVPPEFAVMQRQTQDLPNHKVLVLAF